MLRLSDIRKEYPAGDGKVEALRGVSIEFRESELVSILGPSGCGKTTMLNIIGGLDSYTSGDLSIGGRSTKGYTDRDWDAYRNHSIGFVFQSYNLIPHQTVLQNVELALTLSGIKKSDRRKRAVQALKDVGLGEQLSKRPSQLSGGQMQRVAIARAIVNDPDIILADEPTGALDTETSVTVMEILKKISERRLVIMVTHNPELAQRYSTRIINILDGRITGDSAPLSDAELSELEATDAKRLADAEAKSSSERRKEAKKPSMSLATSFSLSLKNLFTKKGRTILTSFAGSIGIIGIALIFAVSQGMTMFIDSVQEETLSSYPITLESTTVDITTLLTTFTGNAKSGEAHENDAIYQKSMVYDMINALSEVDESENDLSSFNEYLTAAVKDENDTTGLRDAVTGIQYGYGLDPQIYTENIDGSITKSDTEELTRRMLAEYYGMDESAVSSMMSAGGANNIFSSMMSSSSRSTRLWQEMLPGLDGSLFSDIFYDQYELVTGDWPSEYNDILLVVDENNELDEMSLYALGLISEDTISEILEATKNGESIDETVGRWDYDEIMGRDYRFILPSSCYERQTAADGSVTYTDLRDTDTGLKYLWTNAEELHISGIIRPKEGAISSVLSGSIAYTSALTDYIIEQIDASGIVSAQLENTDTDLLTGLPFKPDTDSLDTAEKAEHFRSAAAALSESDRAKLYTKIATAAPEETVALQADAALASMSREDMESAVISYVSVEMKVGEAEVRTYISSMSDDEMTDMIRKSLIEQLSAKYSQAAEAQLAAFDDSARAALFDESVGSYSDEQCAEYFDTALEFSEQSHDEVLETLGYIDRSVPKTINIYTDSFENKDAITDAISDYNDTVDELRQIKYTDYVGIIMSSVTTIINAITYVLIAFVAISLIVSSIMIGVITLISVQERTKEIGILRAIGASKRNVSNMFNAETAIIGFTSGVIGVGITYLLCIVVNIVLHSLTDLKNLNAVLPIPFALLFIAISVLLTLFAGIIPSRSASKKDPVVALRSE